MKINIFKGAAPIPDRNREPSWVKNTIANLDKELEAPITYVRQPSTESMAENLSRIAEDLQRTITLAESLKIEYEIQHRELRAKIESDLKKIDDMQGSLTALRDSLPKLPGGEDENTQDNTTKRSDADTQFDVAGSEANRLPPNSESSKGGKGNLRPVPFNRRT